MIDSEMEEVRFGQNKKNNNKLGTESVFHDYPELKVVWQLMKKLQHLLYQNEAAKKVFTPPTIVSYRSARKTAATYCELNCSHLIVKLL